MPTRASGPPSATARCGKRSKAEPRRRAGPEHRHACPSHPPAHRHSLMPAGMAAPFLSHTPTTEDEPHVPPRHLLASAARRQHTGHPHPLRAPCRPGRRCGHARPASRGHRRRRPRRPVAGHRPGPARPARGAAGQRLPAVHGLARHLLFKRTLEIWDRLGVGQAMVDKGVSWNLGKVFFRTSRCTASTCCPRTATSARPSSTCSSTTPRPTWSSEPCSCR